MKANLIGVSFHVGSGCFGTIAYKNAIQLAKDVITDDVLFSFFFFFDFFFARCLTTPKSRAWC